MEKQTVTGFPSPAQGYEKATLDYNSLLIRHPASTFTMRMRGDSLREWDILSGDLLVVDSSVSAKKNKLVVAEREGEFRCEPFENTAGMVFGTVVAVVRLLR